MHVYFYSRSFGEALDVPFTWTVESFDWSMAFGPTIATIATKEADPTFDATKLLRCPVEIYNDDGACIWWGYVGAANTNLGAMNIGVSLEGMYNRALVYYQSGGSTLDTGWSQATESVAEFGKREYVESLSESTSAAATARRDFMLSQFKYPNVMIEPFASASGKTTLTLFGWGSTLAWQYASQASTTPVDTTTQIADVVTSFGQFLNGTHIGTTSGISLSPFEDGTRTAYDVIAEKIANGTSAGGRLVAIVNRYRYLRIDEVTTPSAPDYSMLDNGRIESLADSLLDETRLDLVIGKYVELKSFSGAIGNYSVLRPFLVESASWQNGRGATLKPVGQFNVFNL